MFAKSLTDPKVRKEFGNSEEKTRIKKGIPDHPYSLMEGISGEICFISDLLRDEVTFPGYEV